MIKLAAEITFSRIV